MNNRSRAKRSIMWVRRNSLILAGLYALSGCGQKTDPDYPEQIAWSHGGGSMEIPPGRNVTVRSTAPHTGYRIRFDHREGNAFLYALGFHPKTGNKMMLEMLRIYGPSPESNEQTREVELLWSLDGKRTLLMVDGQPEAMLDFENERGMCRSRESPMAGPWSTRRLEWNEQVLSGFGSN